MDGAHAPDQPGDQDTPSSRHPGWPFVPRFGAIGNADHTRPVFIHHVDVARLDEQKTVRHRRDISLTLHRRASAEDQCLLKEGKRAVVLAKPDMEVPSCLDELRNTRPSESARSACSSVGLSTAKTHTPPSRNDVFNTLPRSHAHATMLSHHTHALTLALDRLACRRPLIKTAVHGHGLEATRLEHARRNRGARAALTVDDNELIARQLRCRWKCRTSCLLRASPR